MIADIVSEYLANNYPHIALLFTSISSLRQRQLYAEIHNSPVRPLRVFDMEREGGVWIQFEGSSLAKTQRPMRINHEQIRKVLCVCSLL